MKKTLTAIMLIMGVMLHSAYADIPKTINFQGRLTNQNGDVMMDGLHSVAFRLWDQETSGNIVWNDSFTIEVKGGYFNTELGSGMNKLDGLDFNTTYYLDMQTGTDVFMTPRIKLNTSAYAMNVRDAAISTAKIKDGAVTTVKIDNQAITTEKIQNNAVITDKIANNAVTSAKIADGTIATADLADGAVTNTKIANNAINSDKIADGTIKTADIADGAITQAKASKAVYGWHANTRLEHGMVNVHSNSDWDPDNKRLVVTIDFSHTYKSLPRMSFIKNSGTNFNVQFKEYFGRAISTTQAQIFIVFDTKPTSGSLNFDWIAVGTGL